MHLKNIKKIEKSIVASIVMSSLMLFAVSMNVEANDISAESVLKELNGARNAYGLNFLIKNDQLSAAAQAKLDDMLANNYFQHTSPSGVDPWHWLDENGYVYAVAGENLAMDFRTAEAQQKAWMESPTHRKNILNANFQEVGVAVGQGIISGKLTTITVQEFGTRKNFPVLARESAETQGESATEISTGKILGAQKVKLASIGSEFNTEFAVGAISGWTMLLFVTAMSLMSVAAIYLAFDIHRIHRDMRLAKELHHQNVYHISEAEYEHIAGFRQ
ncbi:MAG: CAP domain-containing protein [Candidatus Moranbacteria bacterium]|nr:CAP domain-containing protein [Candidatus Moranbacteria bacterium]